MRSRLSELQVEKSNPFLGDKLGRDACAARLTSLVSTISGGAVISINGEWGCGKTSFVKMWQAHLENNNFKTLYFNIWENDFRDDPMLGLLRELSKQIPKDKPNVKEDFLKLLKPAGKILLSMAGSVASQLVGVDFKEIVKDGGDALADELKEQFFKDSEQPSSTETFREILRGVINDLKLEKPLVFFVDELDRCNPTYAVKTLERIKHLFCIPNIIFVLSVDKSQLANAVRGYYGSDRLNAEEYLRRFIDFDYNLPNPSLDKFCEHLYDYFGFADILKGKDDKERLLQPARCILRHKHVSLRQLEKIFCHTRIALSIGSESQYIRLDFCWCFSVSVCRNFISS